MAAPTIFSPVRRRAMRARMLRLQAVPGAPRYLLEDMIEDVRERLAFLRHVPARVLVLGEWTGVLATHLRNAGAHAIEDEPARGFDEELPYPETGFDLTVSLGTLDTVNDLPGA